MKPPINPVRALRAAWFAVVLAIAGIAIADSGLAVVLVIIGIGLLVLIVPLVVIHYDEHEERLQRHHPGSA